MSTRDDIIAEYHAAGNEVDAASDGALHHAYPGDVADRMVYAIEARYRKACSAFYALNR